MPKLLMKKLSIAYGAVAVLVASSVLVAQRGSAVSRPLSPAANLPSEDAECPLGSAAGLRNITRSARAANPSDDQAFLRALDAAVGITSQEQDDPIAIYIDGNISVLLMSRY